MTAHRDATDDRWSQLSRQDLIALGKTLVSERLESLGATVQAPTSRTSSKLEVRTPSGRSIEVFVSTQRVGGYVFWTKRRFQPASNRFAAIALLHDADEPELYLVPSTDWRSASPPLTDRDNVGKKSEAEYGISLARSSLPALQRYRWDEGTDDDHFR
jgi:SOS-response transcriptional repressor LexA